LGYHGRAVLTDVNLTINSGMRLGLLGSNGAGKSTLVKTLAGELPLVTGQLNLGKYTRVGYFAQHQLEYLDSEASPVQHLEKLSPTTSQQLIRNFLGGFNFIGDQAKQACGHFSGGEKARLALAILVWQRPNVLLLDEPTNHLDLRMRQALSLALQQYTGALVLVSHDRALLEQSCDEYLLVAQQQVQSFAGDMTDYSQQLRQKPAGTGQSATKQPAKSNRQQRQASAQQRQRLQKLKHTIKQLEQQLAQQQQDLAQIEQTLANPELYSQSASSADKDKLKLLLAEQRQLSQAVNTSEEKWLDLVNQLEQLE
jgi:ATP-binding cassette subfamily F protein 3